MGAARDQDLSVRSLLSFDKSSGICNTLQTFFRPKNPGMDPAEWDRSCCRGEAVNGVGSNPKLLSAVSVGQAEEVRSPDSSRQQELLK